MELKKDKDLAAFFDRYSARMLPADNAEFMDRLKREIAALPASEVAKHSESEDCAQRAFRKLEAGYRRARKDSLIAGALTAFLVGAMLILIAVLDILTINWAISTGVFVGVGCVAAGCIYCTTPLQVKEF